MRKHFCLITILSLPILLTGCASLNTDIEETGTEIMDTVSNEENTFIVGVSNLSNNDFFANLRVDELLDMAESDSDMQFIVEDAHNNIEDQLAQIDSFIEQKVSVVVITPVNYELIAPGIKKLNEANIPVISYGVKASGGEYCYIGSPNLDAGRMQGNFIAERLPDDANMLYLEGNAELAHSQERKEGFLEALESQRRDITILDSRDGKYEEDASEQIMSEWIDEYSDFDAVVAANDLMALGAISALQEGNRLDDTIVIGIDGSSQRALYAIENGELTMTVYQNAEEQANQCIQVIENLKNDEQMPEYINVPFEQITKDNVEEYMELVR